MDTASGDGLYVVVSISFRYCPSCRVRHPLDLLIGVEFNRNVPVCFTLRAASYRLVSWLDGKPFLVVGIPVVVARRANNHQKHASPTG